MQCEQKGNGVPHFTPTEEEFYGGFEEFIKKIEPKCLRFGLAKITPPASWKPTRKDVEKMLDSMEIPSPIEQVLQGIKGAFQQTNLEAKPMKVRDFQRLADERARRVAPLSEEEKERQFWKTARFDPPLYGADMGGTLTNRNEKHWNIARLDSLLSRCLPDQLQGVTTAYLYFGMWKAMFAWHTEDMDLFSINMLHLGEPKKWYVIPEHERSRFEQLASFHFPDLRAHCPEFLRHKTTLLSPSILHQNNISVFTTVQHARDIIITFPGAYHCGFNMGFNCAESVNFAVESWIPRGMKAKCCRCTQQQDSVYINMDSFLDSYRSLLPSSPSSSSSSSSSSSEASSPLVDPEDEIVLRRNKKGALLPACRSSSCPSLHPKSLLSPLDPSTEEDEEDDDEVEVVIIKDKDDDEEEEEVPPSTPSPRTRRRRSFPSQDLDLPHSPSSPRKTNRRDRRKSDTSSTSTSSSSSSSKTKTKTRSVAKKEEEKGEGGSSPRYSLRSATSPGSSPPKRLREFVITIPRSKFAKSLS